MFYLIALTGGSKRMAIDSRRLLARVFSFLAIMAVTTNAALAVGRPATVLGDEHKYIDVTALPLAVYKDPSGEMDIDEISHRSDFQTLSSADSSDGRRSVFWIRFSVVRPSRDAIGWYLRTSNSCITADFYEPSAREGYDHHSFGWSVPFARHPYPGDETALALDSAALTGRPVYLRLDCPRRDITAQIASGFTLESDWDRDDVPSFAPVPVALLFAVLGIVFSAMTRERIYLLSSGPPFVLSLFDMFLGGNFSRIFPSLPMPNYDITHTIIAVAFFGAQWLFIRAFLEMGDRMVAPDRVFLAAFVALVLIRIFTQNRYDGAANLAFVLAEFLFYAVPLSCAVIAWTKGSRRAPFFVAGLTSIIVGFVGSNLRSVGITILPPFILNVIGGWNVPFESLMLFVGIADRFRRTTLENQRVLFESDSAKTALVEVQREHIAEINRRNQSFARFVPKEFLEQLGRTDITDVALGDNAERGMSILFTDIRAFTTLVETLSPAETFAFLNSYLKRAGPAIRQNGGFIDKYIGDAIMALFPRNPEDAVEAALTLQREVRQFNDVRARRGDVPIAIGIGINYGSLMLGTIGELERLETTVLADAVNIASRFEGLTKRYGAGIIAGEALVRALPKEHPYHIRPLGVVQLKGSSQTVSAYEIFDGDPSDLLLHKIRTLEKFTIALTDYQQGKFDESRSRFGEIAAANSNDRGAAWLLDRSAMRAESIQLTWDGVDRLESK